MVWSALASAAVGLIGSKIVGDGGAKKANAAAADATTLQTQIEREKWDKYQQVYEPLELEMVADARSYDSPERFKTAAADASAVVSTQFGRARDRLKRQPGMDPSTAGFQAQLAGLELAQAANDSVEQNRARRQVEDVAYTRQNTALAMGKGLDASASAGLATAARNNMVIGQQGWQRSQQDAAAVGQIGAELVTAGSDWLAGRKAKSATPEIHT